MRHAPLTERQAEILKRVAGGLPDKTIARELGISIYTVRSHIARIAVDLPGEAPRRHRLTLFFLNVRPDTD